MNERKESLTTPERKVFGEYETVQLPVMSYVRLPQVRSSINPALPDLKQSIHTNGLINPIDVARMNQSQLGYYIDFVNRTWKTEVDIDDYAMQKQPDDNYYLVVAGHTRTEAIAQLQMENDAAGYEYEIVAKVHPISQPTDIISIQLDENIHTQAPQEQRAIAVIESFRSGLENDLWRNKAEFMKHVQGKFSRKVLDEAMGFAQLPPEARDFVFSKQLSYNAGVALGAASETIRHYVAHRLGYDMVPNEHQDANFERAYRQEVSLMIARICNSKLNGTAAKKFIAGQVGMMTAQAVVSQGDDSQAELFEMVTADQQAQEYLRSLERDFRATLREMGQQSIGTVEQAISLHRRLGRVDGQAELQQELEKRRRLLGDRALSGTLD